MKRNVLILLMITCVSSLFAQKEGFSVYGGGVFPVGKWKDSYVSAGFDAGVKYQYNLPVRGLGVFGSFDLVFNGLTKEGRALYESLDNGSKYDSYKRATPKILNFPIMAGVNYCYNFNNNIGLYSETALGLSICKQTDYRFEGSWVDYRNITWSSSNTIKTKAYANCAFRFGLGVLFWQRMSVGIHFCVFGGAKETKIEHIKTISGNYSDSDRDEYTSELIPMSSFSLRLGCHF